MESLERQESMPVSLENASEADIQELIDTEKSVSGPHTYSPTLDESEWKEELKKNSVYLIKVAGRTVGNFSYEQKSPEHLYISGIVVSPEFQGRGIAKTVLTQFLNQHKEVMRIDLVTHPDNPALKLYQSLGFEVESRQENYWGEGEPRLVLVLSKEKHL